MPFPYKEKLKATEEAFKTLRAGDHFHEMFSFHVFVLSVNNKEIVAIEGSPPCSFPADGKITRYSPPSEFEKRFKYSQGVEGYWVLLASRDNNVEGWLNDNQP